MGFGTLWGLHYYHAAIDSLATRENRSTRTQHGVYTSNPLSQWTMAAKRSYLACNYDPCIYFSMTFRQIKNKMSDWNHVMLGHALEAILWAVPATCDDPLPVTSWDRSQRACTSQP